MLTLSVLGPGGALAQGTETPASPVTTLPAVSVVSVRADGLRPETVEAGTFRGADIMEVPSTVNVVTREALEAQAVTGIYDALRNTAGVTRQQNGGETWDQLVIRGIGVENRTNYRINGSLPYLNFAQIAMENKERVEVLKGASALYYGFTTPSGVVNFVTLRAGSTPVTSVGFWVNSNEGAMAAVDIGRRFGDEQQFGLRVNAAGGVPGSYLDGVSNGSRGFGSLAFDWRVNPQLTLRADVEYERRRVIEQAGVALPPAVNGEITLPHPVDAKRLVGPDWSTFRTETTHGLLRADVLLTDQWALTLEAGRADVDRLRQLAVFRFTNAAAVATGAGRITGNSQDLALDADLLRAELAGDFRLGDTVHQLVVGASRTTKDQAPIYQQNYAIASQNLYDPVPVSGSAVWSPPPTTPTTAAYSTRELGLYAVDRVTLTPQWQVVAGLRHTDYESDQGGISYTPKNTTPLAALLYRPDPNLSFYASFSKGLEEGETAPAGTANVGTRLEPGVSQQTELGVRWLAPNQTLVSAAVFDIDRPGYYTDPVTNVFTSAGSQLYTGLELSAQGRLTPQLSWQASALALNARFKNIGPAYDGKEPENTASRTASLFMIYNVPQLQGLSLNGGAYYTGRRPVNDMNQAWLAGNTLFGLGASYVDTALFGQRSVWQLNVDNVANKEYWAAGGTRLAAGAPRAVKLSVKFDL